MYVLTYIHVHVWFSYTCGINVNTYIHTNIHTNIHTYIPTNIYTYIHTYTHTHTHTHTHYKHSVHTILFNILILLCVCVFYYNYVGSCVPESSCLTSCFISEGRSLYPSTSVIITSGLFNI